MELLRALRSGHHLRYTKKMNFKSLIRTFGSVSVANLIQQHTVISRSELTPEIALHLITPACHLWTAHPDDAPFTDPFWAFYWPGGQALSRYILDNPAVVAGLTVVDVGSGSGACAIAAACSGAQHVIANDIDPVAGAAITLNAALNDVKIAVSMEDLVGQFAFVCDCLLLGDIFYDAEFAERLLPWLRHLRDCGKHVLIGDPGRQALERVNKGSLVCKAEYSLPENSCLENRGFTSSCVWSFI